MANGKQQTANGRFKFRNSQNRKRAELKEVQNNCYRQNQRETTNFGVEIMNSKAQVKGKLCHVKFTFHLP